MEQMQKIDQLTMSTDYSCFVNVLLHTGALLTINKNNDENISTKNIKEETKIYHTWWKI